MKNGTVRRSHKHAIGYERRRALVVGERLSGFSMAMSSLEALTDHRELNDDGVRRASKLHERDPRHTAAGRWLFKALNTKQTLVGIHASRVIAGAALALLPEPVRRSSNVCRGISALHLAVTEGLLSYYDRYGTDGADQAASQILAPAGVARLMGSRRVHDAALWYIGLQGVLSYAVAGVAKIFGSEWRSGQALPGILRTTSYGHQAFWRFIDSRPRLAKFLSYAIVAWETAYPISLIPYPPVTRFFSASAIVFHAVNGYAMGLGRFVWAFAGMHPAINYVAHPASELSEHRYDDLPRAFGLALAGASAGLISSTVARDSLVKQKPLGWEEFTAPSGNVLAYQGRLGTGETLIVFEGGLAAPAETYQWYLEALRASSNFSVLGYERAGYGASQLVDGSDAEWTLEAAVADLAALIDYVRVPTQRVVIAAHSLGGEIARRLCRANPEVVSGLILIDSTNLNQFVDGSLSNEKQNNLLRLFSAQARITRAGLGALITVSTAVDNFPVHVRKRAAAQERNHRLWASAYREYQSLLAQLPDGPIQLFSRNIPCLTIASQATVEVEQQKNLQQQLVLHTRGNIQQASGINPDLLIFPGKHDTVISTPIQASRVAEVSVEFIQQVAKHQEGQYAE